MYLVGRVVPCMHVCLCSVIVRDRLCSSGHTCETWVWTFSTVSGSRSENGMPVATLLSCPSYGEKGQVGKVGWLAVLVRSTASTDRIFGCTRRRRWPTGWTATTRQSSFRSSRFLQVQPSRSSYWTRAEGGQDRSWVRSVSVHATGCISIRAHH